MFAFYFRTYCSSCIVFIRALIWRIFLDIFEGPFFSFPSSEIWLSHCCTTLHTSCSFIKSSSYLPSSCHQEGKASLLLSTVILCPFMMAVDELLNSLKNKSIFLPSSQAVQVHAGFWKASEVVEGEQQCTQLWVEKFRKYRRDFSLRVAVCLN